MRSWFAQILLFLIIILSHSSFSQTKEQLPSNLAKEVADQIEQAENLERSGDYNQAAFFLNRAATTFWVNGFPLEAIALFEKTIELNKSIGNLNALRTLNNNIGMIYTDEENFPKAFEYFNRSLELSRQMNRKPDEAEALLNVANIQAEWGKYVDAAKTLDEANALARELNNERLLRNCYSLQASVYEKLGNSEKSAEYFSLYTALTRKIQREEMRKREGEAKQMVEEAKSKVSEIEKAKQITEGELLDKQRALKETEESLEHIEQISSEQQMQIELLNKEKELKDAKIKNQELIRNIFILIIFVVVGFALLILHYLNVKKRANAKLSQQNHEIAKQRDLIEQVNNDLEGAFNKIEKQNRDITSSINYAQRIQQAMLPNPENLSNVVSDSFVLLKPRDIVSGDFYWFTGYGSPELIDKKLQKNFIKVHNLTKPDIGFLITAVDCTGHGIPGALMSMIGFNLLDTITRNGIVKPNEILQHLHKSIRFLLKQKSSDNRDGMDMAICSIKENGKKVLFAGAKNPLIYISNGELGYIKGDPIPVGGLQIESKREFTLHTIEVDKPTSFYIFSDGFIDQFGGLTGQKYGSKRLKEILLEINELPMQKQKVILDQHIENWMGNKYKQLDDILILGFKIGDRDINILKL
jgi:serine phosphatase RsbU (regulator of sigma subunit)